MKYLILFGIISFLTSCTVKKQPDFSNCDTENLGIDTSYRFTPMAYSHPDGSPYFSNDSWKWVSLNDTIVIWGHLDSGGEAGITRLMFFKKDCNCINLIYVKETYCSDEVVIDENGNMEIPCNTYDINNVELRRQTYIEDSLLVGKVGNYAFWVEFSPQYFQSLP